VDGEDDVEGAEDGCACACPIKTPAPTTIAHPLAKSCATTSRPNLLPSIAVSFEPNVLATAFCCRVLPLLKDRTGSTFDARNSLHPSFTANARTHRCESGCPLKTIQIVFSRMGDPARGGFRRGSTLCWARIRIACLLGNVANTGTREAKITLPVSRA
jgi:hypothetical protein